MKPLRTEDRTDGRVDGWMEARSMRRLQKRFLFGRSVCSVSGSVGEADRHEAPQLGRPDKLTVLVPEHILGGEG